MIDRRRCLRTLTGISASFCWLGGALAADKEARVPTVVAVYATPLEEPWNDVIHSALLAAREKGKIRYTWQDKGGTGKAMEKALRTQIDKAKPDVVFGDAFGSEEEVGRVAADHPKVAFVMGSNQKPRKPNLSTFDDLMAEPAYLCGLIAGKLTKSNVLGVVGGFVEADSNRNINAFIQGARDVNPKVKVKVAFIESWYDPDKAHKLALQQIDAGADLLYAERVGVIEAARDKKVLAFGNLEDRNKVAPETVITGPVWNMGPAVDHVIAQVAAGKVAAEDLRGFMTMAKGGARLADWHGWDKKLPADVLKLVEDKRDAIKEGRFKVAVNPDKPKGD